MATLEGFLRTGTLGPVVLGMSLPDLIASLGEPEGTSRKSNPLQLKYGSAQLSFWRAPRNLPYQLREIAITYQPKFEPLPEPLTLTDWNLVGPPTELQFISFTQKIDYRPVVLAKGVMDRELIFLSGVVALTTDGMLHSIRFLQREARALKPMPVFDDREPSKRQIYDMLDEAEAARKVGAERAALLLAWAGLEATLRRCAVRAGRQGKIGLQPAMLVHELLAAGRLTQKEHHKIEQLRQLRSIVAHGLAPTVLDVDDLSEIRALVERLFAADELDRA
jgi:hypothetical protein